MEKRSQKILIIDDEKPIRDVLAASLEDEGHEVFTASDGASGIEELIRVRPGIVFLDIWMPGELDGIGVLKHYQEHLSQSGGVDAEFVVMSGHGTIETAVKATKLGAWDFIEKPISLDKISILISNISQLKRARGEKRSLLNRLRRDIAIVGSSSMMINIKKSVSRVASSPNWVLICGKEGTGKRLLAQNLHYLSARVGFPFVEFNCATISPELLLGELFGYSGMDLPGGDRKGKIELSYGGTLYLNHIEHLSLEAQERLAALLQDNDRGRDLRIVAATVEDLSERVRGGDFREDLFQRLQMNSISVPNLSERKEDIPILVSHFNDIFCREGGFTRKKFSESAMKKLAQHSWAGNVRELRNFIERVYILTPGECVDSHDILFAGLSGGDSSMGEIHDFTNFRQARADFEKKYLTQKIKDNGGNISKTAEVIGLERSYLHRKIKNYGIEV